MRKTLMTVAAMAMVAVMASCGGNANTNNKAEECKGQKTEACDEKKADSCTEKKAEADAPAATIDLSKKYICPSRCESSDTPGDCSQCGMELVENN